MNRNQLPLVVVLVSIPSGAVGALLALTLGRESAAAPPPVAHDPVAERFQELESGQRELRAGLEALGRDLAAAPGPDSGDGRVSLGEVERLVALALERRGLAAAPADATEPAPSADAELDLEQLGLALLVDGLSETETQALWDRAHEAGRTDELLAWFRERAETDPDDPDLQVDLANAFFQKLYVTPEGPARGPIAMAADAALDRALTLDDHHWEARFSKAVSLSFWPPVFGKQQEAINHFQTLVDQQATQPPREGFASTHLLLGNMYQQTGQIEKALAAWRRGAELFPDDAQLQEQLAAHQ